MNSASVCFWDMQSNISNGTTGPFCWAMSRWLKHLIMGQVMALTTVPTLLSTGREHHNLSAPGKHYVLERPGQIQTWGKAGDDEVLLLHFLSAKLVIPYATFVPH